MNTHLAQAYIKHLLTAKNAHALHSPYLFGLYNEAIRSRKMPSAQPIEELRKKLLRDDRLLEVVDLGAGSKAGLSQERRVKQLAATVTVAPKYGALLSRLISFSKAKNILELGTSLGIGTSYLAFNELVSVTSVDACGNTQKVAQENLIGLGLSERVEFVNDSFDGALKGLLKEGKKWDLVYVDGDHRYSSTLRYFKQLLPYLHEESVLVFDDIYWSPGMTKAWEEIKADPAVRQSVDVLQFGMVFFRPNQLQEHFRLRL